MCEVPNQFAGVKTVISTHGAAVCRIPVFACSACRSACLQAVHDDQGRAITSDRPLSLDTSMGWHVSCTGSGQYMCSTPSIPQTLVAAEVCDWAWSLSLKGLSSQFLPLLQIRGNGVPHSGEFRARRGRGGDTHRHGRCSHGNAAVLRGTCAGTRARLRGVSGGIVVSLLPAGASRRHQRLRLQVCAICAHGQAGEPGKRVCGR